MPSRNAETALSWLSLLVGFGIHALLQQLERARAHHDLLLTETLA